MTIIDAAICFEDDGTISIAARPTTLAALGRALAEAMEDTVDLTPPASESADCGEHATGLRVRWDADPGVSVVREGSEVVFVGNPSAVTQLASNIVRLGCEPAMLGGHIHLEYFPEHSYLRDGSIPLVVIAT